MKDGFIKVAAATVNIAVADIKSNREKICEKILKADICGVNLLVLPELCVTGYTCADLFFSSTLINEAHLALKYICDFTLGKYQVVVIGLPLKHSGRLYNCVAVIHNGKILGIIPKTAIPNYNEFSEKRYFDSASNVGNTDYEIDGNHIPFSSKLIFKSSNSEDFIFGIEICEDLWEAANPSVYLCRAGATIIANPSASDEIIGKAEYRRLLVAAASAKQICGYVYSSADCSESTQDLVFSRHALIYENGKLLAENPPFGEAELTVSEIDVACIANERLKNTEFIPVSDEIRTVEFTQSLKNTVITRHINKNPFVSENKDEISQKAELILNIQANGLKKRLEHTGAKTAVIGISGGLDSTLALIVAVRAMKLLGRNVADITAVTMPCFGTTERTKSNAVSLCEQFGIAVKEINISKSVLSHFADIGQNPENPDVTFENSQARERTQVLMDIANQTNGLVIGTGDLSELALGWATYNGDHMSMYGVNASIPKTLIRYIVKYEADKNGGRLGEILNDILDTPVSPELLPVAKDGKISQKTEDFVGPYELHDFFLYYMLRFSFTPAKIFRLATVAFSDEYDENTILHWLNIFIKRFFSQQFKRSCLPDGPKVGSVTLSPRGDWRMPSDASARIWLDEINNLCS